MLPRSLITGVAAATLLSTGLASAQGLGFVDLGPVNEAHGFPDWYEDANGVRLDLCLGDPALCLLDRPATLRFPARPFPQNFAGTFPGGPVYNLVEAAVPTNGDGEASLTIALAAGFDGEVVANGSQVVFTHFRIRADNLIGGQTYQATTPIGVFEFVAEGSEDRGINFTEDTGAVPTVFDGVLTSAFGGPFLRWDTDLPIVDAAGREYIGDPAVEHAITGSPYGTNVFRLEGPSVGGPGVDVVETNLFTVAGLLSEDQPPDPLLDLSPGLAGVTNTLSVSDGTPGGLTIFVFGFDREIDGFLVGTGPCAGLLLDIADPRYLGLDIVAADGTSSMDVQVPLALADERVVVQAVDVASCMKTNVIRHRFPD